MMLILAGFTLITLSFILGFALQGICLWIDGKNKYKSPQISELLPWMIKMWYWRFRILFLSLFKRKEKQYVKEMKKVLSHGLLERNLFNALMEERNPKNIRHIIEVVFHSMEKNRRKKLLNQTFKFRNFFFIKNIYIEHGYGSGNNLVHYVELFVLYNRYLGGEYMPPGEAALAAKLFGFDDEENVTNFENSIIQKNKNLRNQWKEMKKETQFKQFQEKTPHKEGVKVQ
ncbi:hypothetical protein [Bacillus cereus]|nr:hypothetical protein [Bacillus cereus]